MAILSRDISRQNTMSREENPSLARCVAFYLEVYGRPTFLQRNLRKVLAYHQQKLSTPKQGPRKPDMQPIESENSTTRFWNPKEIANILERRAFSDHDPVLQIDITDIRDRVAKFRNTNQVLEATESPTRSDAIPALCCLTIWDSSLATKVEQTRTCNIHPHKKADKQRYASVELSSPFMVPLRKLHSESRSSTAGEITYSTQFVIVSVTDTEVWPPVEMQLPVPKNPQLRDDGVTFVKAPLLVAKWTRLPYLPEKEEDSLMEIKALQDDKTYKPKLSLKLDAKWINADSPLETYNKEQRAKSAIKLEAQTESENTVIQTEWIFQGVVDYMENITLPGYMCPLCHNRRFKEPAEYHFHLQNNHDLFTFDYSIQVETNQSGQSVSLGLVRVEIAKAYQSCIKKPPESIAWQRPKRPFDIEAYLKGSHAWLQGDTKPVQDLSAPKSDMHRSISTDQNRGEAKKSRKRAIEDIPDIIITRKRRFKVPPAPQGIAFYRTVSKVPLVEGDELSESDDDINEEWLLEKHADTIDSFTDTLPKEKLFIQRFDRHMLLEDTCSDLHSEEALVRFCKQNTAWLRRHDMKFEFAKKVAALTLNRLVSNDVLVACWRIINDMSVLAEPQDDRADPNIPNGTRTHRHDRLLENEHLYGRCGECSKGIHDLHELLCCANGHCPNKTFHLRCCLKTTTNSARPKVWFCRTCSRNGFNILRPTSLASRPSKLNSNNATPNKTNTESSPQPNNTKLTNGITTTNTHPPEKQRPVSRASALPTPNSTTSISTTPVLGSAEPKIPLSNKPNTEPPTKSPPQSSPATPQTSTKLDLPAKKKTWQATSDPNLFMVLDSSEGGDTDDEDENEDEGRTSEAKEDSDYVNSDSGSEGGREGQGEKNSQI